MSTENNYFFKKRKKCLFYSNQSLVTGAGVTSLKLEQTWVPRLDCPGAEGAGKDVVAKQPPLDL